MPDSPSVRKSLKRQKKKQINLHSTRVHFDAIVREDFPIFAMLFKEGNDGIINFSAESLAQASLPTHGTNGAKGNLIIGNCCNVHEDTHLCGNRNGTETNNNAI